MQPCGNGLLQLLQTCGVQEVEKREAGPGVYIDFITSPVDTSVLVPGHDGCGCGGGWANDNGIVCQPRTSTLRKGKLQAEK